VKTELSLSGGLLVATVATFNKRNGSYIMNPSISGTLIFFVADHVMMS
jgi:hypothetical protein